MAFKNALKLLLNKFGLVWILLLYILFLVTVIFFSSLPFAIPLIKAISEAGIGVHIENLFNGILAGQSMTEIFNCIYIIMNALRELLAINKYAAVNTVLLLVVVFGFIYRFFIGLYEIPLTKILEGAMSSSLRVGFMSSFISCLGKSSVYVLVKMIYTVVFDALLILLMYQLFSLFGINYILNMIAPFIIMLVFVVLIALRYTVMSMWAPSIIITEKGIFRSFGHSIKRSLKNFASIYSTFVITWILMVAFNLLIGVFTFGVGLLITMPVSMLFISILNMTVYYGKNDRRYYVDTTVINPPACK